MGKRSTFLIILVFSICLAGCGPKEFMGLKASDLFPELSNAPGTFREPVTVLSTPANELSAVVSPLGDSLLYVSDEQGNTNIYLSPIRGNGYTQLTTQSADDLEPAFSPDGALIAYVSMEEDSKGDIWLMKANGKRKKRLTFRETADRTPIFSPDGRYIYYVGRRGVKDIATIYRVPVKGGKSEDLGPGFDPAPLYDGQYLIHTVFDENHHPRLAVRNLQHGDKKSTYLTKGDYLEGFPRVFSGQKYHHLVFSRFCDDTNGDGLVDGDDRPSLWRLDITITDSGLKYGEPFPLTTGQTAEIFGFISGNVLFFTATDNDHEIKALPIDGVISREVNDETIYALALASHKPVVRRTLLRYLVSRGGVPAGRARYELAKELSENEEYDMALKVLRAAIDSAHDEPDFEKVLILEEYRITVFKEEKELSGGKVHSYLKDRLENLPNIHQESPEDSLAVAARYATIKAELSYKVGERSNLVKNLENLLAKKDVPLEDVARARRVLSNLALSLGRLDEVKNLEFNVLRLNAQLDYHKNKAVNVLLNNMPAAETPADYLQNLADGASDIPLLATSARLKLADYYKERTFMALAAAEYEKILTAYPAEKAEAVTALRELAKMAEDSGDRAAALDYWERIVSDYSTEWQEVKEARSSISRLALLNAKAEENKGNIKAALENYRRMIKADENSIIAHRHLIALSAKLGTINETIASYRAEVAKNPDKAAYVYGLGLALTWQIPLKIDEAEKYVKKAKALDPRLAEAYLTLGWIEEQRYNKDPFGDHLEKAVDHYMTALNEGALSETVADAKQNIGNAFFLMGKDDLAFSNYLSRELDPEPFSGIESELIFRERFGRVALRKEYFDVALTELNDAERLSRDINYPRRGELLMLLGFSAYAQENYDKAAKWYQKAAETFTAAARYDKALTARRAEGYALELAGKYQEAEEVLGESLAMLARYGGAPSHKYALLEFEMSLESNNVTRAPYGFDAAGEEELLRHRLATIFGREGRLDEALNHYERKLALLEKAKSNRHVAEAVDDELIYTYNQLGVLRILLGELKVGEEFFLKAFTLAEQEEYLNFGGKLAAANNLLSLLRYGLPLSAELEKSLNEFWEKYHDNCRRELRKPCNKFLISMASYELSKVGGRDSGEINGGAKIIEKFMQDTALISRAYKRAKEVNAIINDAATEGAAVADYGDYSAAADNIKAHGEALSGNLEEARKISLKSIKTASAAMKWRLIWDRYFWDTEERAALTKELLDELLKGGQAMGRANLWSHDFREALSAIFSTLGDEDGKKLLELANLWRSLQLKTTPWGGSAAIAGKAFNAAELLLKLNGSAYILEQNLLGKELLLIAYGENIFKFYGEKKAAEDWLNEKLTAYEGQVFYLDTLSQDGEKTLKNALMKRENIFTLLAISPAHLYKALTAQTFSTRGPLYIGGETINGLKGLNTLAGVKDLKEQKDQIFSREYVIVDIPLTVSLDGQPLYIGADGKLSAYRPAALRTPLIIFNRLYKLDDLCNTVKNGTYLAGNICLPLAPDFVKAVNERLGADADRLAEARLVAASMEQGAALVAVTKEQSLPRLAGELDAVTDDLKKESPGKILTEKINDKIKLNIYGAIGLDGAAGKKLAESEYKKAAGEGSKYYKNKIWAAATEPFIEATAALDYQGKSSASVRNLLSQVYGNLGEVDKAIAEQQSVLDEYIREKKSANIATSMRILGKLYRDKDNIVAAELFEKAAKEFNKLNKKADEGDSYILAGKAYSAVGAYDKALNAHRRALAIFIKLDNNRQYEANRYIGIIYENNYSNYRSAMNSYNAIYSAALKKGDEKEVRTVLVDLTRVARSQGNYQKALELAGRALASLPENEEKAKAEILLEMAKIYWYRGEYRQALLTDGEVLDIAQKLGNIFLEIQAVSLKGLIARNQGDLDNAAIFLEQALNMAERTGRQGEVANQLNNLGIVYREQGNIKEAIETFNHALALDEKMNNKEGIAFDKRNLGVAQTEAGDLKNAEENLLASLKVSQRISSKFNELECRYALGQLYEKQGDNKSAREYYQSASTLGQKISVADVEWRALYAQALLDIGAQKTAAAREELLQAVTIVEGIGRSGGKERTPTREELYGTLVALLLEEGEAALGLEFFERYKERSYLDFVSGRDIGLQKEEGYAIWEEIEGLSAGDQNSDTNPAEIATRKNELKNELLAKNYRLAANLFVDGSSLDLGALTWPEKSAFLAAFLTPQGVALWWWDKSGGLTARLIKTDMKKFRTTINNIPKLLNNFVPMEEELTQISEIILAPFAAKLPEVKSLAFVLEGPLAALPVAALSYKGKSLLKRDIATWLVPSLKLAVKESAALAVPSVLLLAGSGPEVTPYAKLEIKAIAAEHKKLSEQLNGFEPKRQGIARGNVLHLAGHTVVDSQDPLATIIRIDDKNSLTLQELLQNGHLPPLLVLSSCATAAGGEGPWLNIRKAFLLAGSKTVVASNSRVSDLSTGLLMKYFYRHWLKDGEPMLLAWHEAQKQVAEKYRHPAHWASFNLAGRPE